MAVAKGRIPSSIMQNCKRYPWRPDPVPHRSRLGMSTEPASTAKWRALMRGVLSGPPGSRVFDTTISLDQVPDGYRAMANREALKILIRN